MHGVAKCTKQTQGKFKGQVPCGCQGVGGAVLTVAGDGAEPCGRVLTRVPVRNKSWPLRVRAGRRPARPSRQAPGGPSAKAWVPDSITVPGPQAGCLRGAKDIKGDQGIPTSQVCGGTISVWECTNSRPLKQELLQL